MKGKQKEMAMRQVQNHAPVNQRCDQKVVARWFGLALVGFSLLATPAFAQNGSAPGFGNLPPAKTDQVPLPPASVPQKADGKACCTPGKDCACVPGVNCPCTPGKNCSCTPGVNCPARPPLRADFCTPGKNCPCVGDNCRYCTPGKDCPCTPFINCPNDFGVIFEKNAGQISDDNKQKLARAVEELKKLPETETIRIEGHTTPSEANAVPPARLKLSQERARSVEQALLAAGLPPARIAPGGVRGWGGLCPQVLIAEDEKNRRVQFLFSQDVTLCAHPESQRRGANLPPYKKPPVKTKAVVKPGQVKASPAAGAKK